jgi:hypothetical protein
LSGYFESVASGASAARKTLEIMRDIRPPPIFIAEAKALDFLNSIATPVDTPVEWLGSGDDLLSWLKEARLAPPEVLKAFKNDAVPGELDAVAAQARSLREWFRGFVFEHKGKPLRPNALQQLERLNRILTRDEEFGQIAALTHGHDTGHPIKNHRDHSSSFVWVPQRRWRSPEALLLPIARAMADLICTENFTHVKACEGTTCTLIFADHTRNHGRRWCSMAVCGNRAKQAAHRERNT